MSKYKKPMTPEEIAQVKDSAINFSDILGLNADFWNNAEIVQAYTIWPVKTRTKKINEETIRILFLLIVILGE